MRAIVTGPAHHIGGTVQVPGDKSVSHRALILAALAQGESTVRGLAPGADVRSTAHCLRQLGVHIQITGDVAVVRGVGLQGLQTPTDALDCGNSGSTLRMLMGVLAGAGVTATLVGDASLTARPMERVARPLRAMGATVTTTDGHAPVTVQGRARTPICWQSEPPSAQVKTALLLAGLFLPGQTWVQEAFLTRDHTERMLPTFGVAMLHAPGRVGVQGPAKLLATEVLVPGDFSSAAFLLALGAICPGPPLTIQGVGLNESRTGFLDALAQLDVVVDIIPDLRSQGEPMGALRVTRPDRLTGAAFSVDVIGRAVDEVPVLSALCGQALGQSTVRGAAELRVKESDRLAQMALGLEAMGATVVQWPDGLDIGVVGQTLELHGATVDSAHDHRIAMAFAIAGLAAHGQTVIEDAQWADISFPGFWRLLNTLTDGAVRLDV